MFYLLYGINLSDQNKFINGTMGKIGFIETVLLLGLVVTIIILLIMAANKLINCGLPNRDKVLSAGRLFILTAMILAGGCRKQYNEKEFLTEVSDKLRRIKSATYFSTATGSAPGDTLKFSEPWTQYVKIFINPDDTLVGSGSLQFKGADTTVMTDFYDGIARGTVNFEERYVKIDSFRNDPYPF